MEFGNKTSVSWILIKMKWNESGNFLSTIIIRTDIYCLENL